MTTDKVLVSVLMPAYNANVFIREAIQSVLTQKGVTFELLICDDGSTDETRATLKSFGRDPRVRLFQFRRNCGAAKARNKLLSVARGKYISICDADDQLLFGNLFVFSRFLDRNPKVGVIYGDWFVQSRSRRCVKIRQRFEYGKAWDLLGGHLPGGGAMMRTALVKKVGGYRSKFKYLEDCDLLVRLSEITRFHYYKGKPLYFQNKSKGSLSDQPSKKLLAASKMLLRDAIQRRYGVKTRW